MEGRKFILDKSKVLFVVRSIYISVTFIFRFHIYSKAYQLVENIDEKFDLLKDMIARNDFVCSFWIHLKTFVSSSLMVFGYLVSFFLEVILKLDIKWLVIFMSFAICNVHNDQKCKPSSNSPVLIYVLR